MTRRVHATKRRALSVFLTTLALILLLPLPALATPPAQQSGWVLKSVELDQLKSAVLQGNTVSVGPSSTTIRRVGETFDGAYDITYTLNYPAPPSQLSAGQTLNLSLTASQNLATGQKVLQASSLSLQIRSDASGFFPSGSQSIRDSRQEGALNRTTSSATLTNTVTVPSPESPSVLKVNGLPTMRYSVGVFTSGSGRHYNNNKLVEYTYVASGATAAATPTRAATSVSPGAVASPTAVPDAQQPFLEEAIAERCFIQDLAVDELRVRSLASQKSLEILREYHQSLAQKEIELSESLFWDSIVDFGAIVAGWPLGAAVQEALLGKAALNFTETLIKGGFKSVNQKIAKDPSGEAVFNHVLTVGWPDEALIHEGGVVDVGMEALKFGATEVVGEVAAETAFGVFDVLKFGWSAYAGMTQQEALRTMKNRVFDIALALEGKHAEQVQYWSDAKEAHAYCAQRVRDQQPPDDADPVNQRVMEYLGW